MYGAGITGENYLRGVQVADTKGRVTFKSIYPACYSGRWPHIHFEVYRNVTEATGGGTPLVTSQLALPRTTSMKVYSHVAGYEQSVTNLNRVSISSDMVFGDDGGVARARADQGQPQEGAPRQAPRPRRRLIGAAASRRVEAWCWGWDPTSADRACRDHRGDGSLRWLRWSRQARPAGGRVPARAAERVLDRLDQRVGGPSRGLGTGAGAGPPLIELVEMSAGSAPCVGCGVSTGSTSGWAGPSAGSERVLGLDRPLIELVEMSAGSAPCVGCGGLDRLDQRVGGSQRGLRSGLLGLDRRSSSLSRCPQGRLPALVAVVSTGSTSGWAGPSAGCGGSASALFDRLDQRWAPALGLGRRSSSLSRCPQARLPALPAVVSTGSTSGWAGPSAGCGGSAGAGPLNRQARPAGGRVLARARNGCWGWTAAHRACRDVRRVGSQRCLRRSRQARPAGGRVPARAAERSCWGWTAAHRACRDVRRLGSQRCLRWSRQARPAGGRVPARGGRIAVLLVELKASRNPGNRCSDRVEFQHRVAWFRRLAQREQARVCAEPPLPAR